MAGDNEQLLLFPCRNPLTDKLGRAFFLGAPKAPGAYRFLDREGTVLYVGSSVNLRQRLSSYRYAKPGKTSRKVVRLVAQVTEANFETRDDLLAARQLENDWIRLYRPRFNSVNAHPESNVLIGVSGSLDRPILQWTRSHREAKDWKEAQAHGAFRSRVALRSLRAIRRLVWWRRFPDAEINDLPWGWVDGSPPRRFALEMGKVFGKSAARAGRKLSQFWVAKSAALPNRLAGKSGEIIARCRDPLLRHLLERDRQALLRFHKQAALRNRDFRAIARLPRKSFIGQAQLDDFLTLPLR